MSNTRDGAQSMKPIKERRDGVEQYILEHTDRIAWVHHKADCLGRVCSVHHKSLHHMREFPQNWRSDRGLMERICSHGIGHPDPDHLSRLVELFGLDGKLFRESAVHGCDNCCAPPPKAPKPKKAK